MKTENLPHLFTFVSISREIQKLNPQRNSHRNQNKIFAKPSNESHFATSRSYNLQTILDILGFPAASMIIKWCQYRTRETFDNMENSTIDSMENSTIDSIENSNVLETIVWQFLKIVIDVWVFFQSKIFRSQDPHKDSLDPDYFLLILLLSAAAFWLIFTLALLKIYDRRK